MRYGANGTFYDKYCNVQRSGETEGNWEYDAANSKLTCTYQYMGQTQFSDFTVKNPTEIGFILSSTKVADHVLEKIVETYQLEVWNTANIQFATSNPSYTVQSYTSKNERIASVTADGTITAEGEKGTTYIKVATDKGNVWVKVIVGDDCPDLWYDYVSIIGMDYANMSKALSVLGSPVASNDYAFAFTNPYHDVVDMTKTYICPEDGMVEEIQLVLKEDVPESEILSYMNSHYYKFAEADEYVYYSTIENMENSKSVICYNKATKEIIFVETQHFLGLTHTLQDLWKDFTTLFGQGKTAIKSVMGNYSYLQSNDSYSQNGSDYYNIANNEYAYMVGFVFNPDNLCSEYWVYLSSTVDKTEVKLYLNKKYTEDITESDNSDYSFIYYNHDKSLKIEYDIKNMAVIYTNLTMKQHEPNKDILGKYYEGLGMTHDQIIAQWGNPYKDENGQIWYYIGSAYVSLVNYEIAPNTGKCGQVWLTHTESLTTEDIIEYMTSRYTVFANGTTEDGSQYAWTNGPSKDESTFGIIYRPSNRLITYVDLAAASSQSSIHSWKLGTN